MKPPLSNRLRAIQSPLQYGLFCAWRTRSCAAWHRRRGSLCYGLAEREISRAL